MANPLLEVERRIVGDIHTSREVMHNLEVLCDDFGSRWAGGGADRLAADFFQARCREYGLEDARLEAFSFTGWRRGPAALRVVSPVERAIPCLSLPMCPASAVEGGLADVGDGGPGQFDEAAGALPGRMALICSRPPRHLSRTVHRSEKYQRAALAGAVAFLYVNQYEGYGPETGSIANDREALIPGVGLSHEEGQLLLRLQRRHGPLKLRLETTDSCHPATSWNVAAELSAASGPGEWVLVGCHYDGHDISQGAHDPASGAVALLEAARVLAPIREHLGCGIRFVLFSAEETGLLGARRYVAAHEDELDSIRLMLNLDAAGGPGPKGLVVNRWPELEPFFDRCRQEMAAELPVGQRTSAFSDHFPFFLQGVPTAMMGNPGGVNTGRGFDHTAWDTLDKVRIGDLREAAAVAARLALRISREHAWPAARRSPDEVRALMRIEANLEGQAIADATEELYAARAGRGT